MPGGNCWVVLYDTAGQQVLNSLRTFGAPLPAKDPIADQVVRVAETCTLAISNLVFGPARQQWVIAMNVPVVRDGKVVYVLGIGTLAKEFSQILVNQAVPGNWLASIYDRHLVFVARTRNADQYIGKPAGQAFAELARQASEGVMEVNNMDGIPSIIAYARYPPMAGRIPSACHAKRRSARSGAPYG